MRIAVLGAGGGLGRNVVDAARAAKHDVVALVRDPKRAELPDDVTTLVGDATRVDDVVRAMTGADATMFCVNPALATWLTTFLPLLDRAIAAARQTNTRLLFPANVWIYGSGRADDLVTESRMPSPISQRGKLRAEMERQIRAAGIRYAMVRLPEFYGPSVNSLTTRVFRAALAGRRTLWPGPLEVAIELVYMPDAARALSRDRCRLRRRRVPSAGRADAAAPVR
jgi:nucleoside-diphosphate-sugar epimerase